MAQINTQYQYSSYGNLATKVQTLPRYEEMPLERTAPRTQEKTKAIPQAVPRTKQALAPVAIGGFLLAGALLVSMLYMQIQLTQVTAEAASLNSQISTLETENSKLKIKHESAFNFTEIETYAVNELGMQEPRSGQVVYVNSTAADKAIVLADQEKTTILDRISDALVSLKEYFN